ncbi:MAG TPA: FUSC family protein, partial [Rhizomicrobium sp.]|nr:FUSC family protein [Rhizomicrobium sp.]
MTLPRFIREHEIAGLFALRMGLSAVLAYLAAALLHAPETTWPVMSAIIVARASGQSPGGSAFDRLAGTLAGAAAGLLGGWAAHSGMPEFVVLALVITPLAFLSSDYGAFRAAPVAALIVMSAAETHGSGVAPAVLRVGDVGLGALAALIVSRFVMPGLPSRALKQAIAELTEPL